ncbi:MAG: hypothetical protein F9K23_18295 [Bacteroidetes bacterium]|nr:MAG: hypothetical protein F9K23_18295 [Bacteroidota bacterium]
MNKTKKERELLQDEATLTALDNSIQDVQNQIDTVVAKRQAIEVGIARTPEGVANLKQFWKMKNLENSEQFLSKKLDRLKYQKSLLEPQRNIPSRDPEDTFDEYAAAEREQKAIDAERALEKSRQNKMNKENDKEMDR